MAPALISCLLVAAAAVAAAAAAKAPVRPVREHASRLKHAKGHPNVMNTHALRGYWPGPHSKHRAHPVGHLVDERHKFEHSEETEHGWVDLKYDGEGLRYPPGYCNGKAVREAPFRPLVLGVCLSA